MKNTLGNESWLRENESKLRALFPDTWTHASNINPLQLMFGLKLIGVDWRTEEEFKQVLKYLERIKIVLRDGVCCRANPHGIFE